MKSDFSRFLHRTLSHFNGKLQPTPMLSYSGLTQISRWNKFANCFDLDTPIKSECDTMRMDAVTCRGRSMVEMLGVLAIIGILSVGAIAGYSKAMFKYKLNKHAEQLNQLFNGITQYYHQLNNGDDLFPILKKLNIIPVEMLTDSNTYIRDAFGNYMYTTVAACPNIGGTCTTLYYNLNPDSNQDIAVCRNIVNTVKENAADLYMVELLGNWGQEGSSQAYFTGNAWCGKFGSPGTKCLKDVTLYDMEDMCSSAKGKNDAHLKIFWRA